MNGFARLYQAIRSIQHEIEDLMPEFEEQMESLLYVKIRAQVPPTLFILPIPSHPTVILSLFLRLTGINVNVEEKIRST